MHKINKVKATNRIITLLLNSTPKLLLARPYNKLYVIFKHRTNIPDPPIIIYCLPMKHRERVGNNAWKRGPRESTMSQCTTLFLSWKSRAFLVELKLVVNELLMPVLGEYDAFPWVDSFWL